MCIDIVTVPLGFDQCYVLKGEGAIVIDAGEPKKGAIFASALAAVGIRPNEIRLIVLTHGHWDHIGSANEIKSMTGAPLAMHSSEATLVESTPTPLSSGITAWGRIFTALHKLFMPLIKVPPVRVDLTLGDDGLSLVDYGVRGRIIHTPGHTQGSVSVLLDTGEAFVGDLAMNRFPLRLSPGLPIFADDPAALTASWKSLLQLGASTVFPAHGRSFPAAVIDKAISGVA